MAAPALTCSANESCLHETGRHTYRGSLVPVTCLLLTMGQAAVTKKRDEPVGTADALNARVAVAVTSARVSPAGLGG
jgi:hypothetical protein